MNPLVPIILAALGFSLTACHEPSTQQVWREPDLAAWRAAREAQRQERAARGYTKPAKPPIPGALPAGAGVPGVPVGEQEVRVPLRPGDAGWDYRQVRPPLRETSGDIGPRQWQSIDRYYHRRGTHFDPHRGMADATHDFDTRLRPPVYLDRLERLNDPPGVYGRRWELLNVPPNERRPADIDARIEHRVRESRP